MDQYQFELDLDQEGPNFEAGSRIQANGKSQINKNILDRATDD